MQQTACQNGCGFFGAPEWGGYCSKCVLLIGGDGAGARSGGSKAGATTTTTAAAAPANARSPANAPPPKQQLQSPLKRADPRAGVAPSGGGEGSRRGSAGGVAASPSATQEIEAKWRSFRQGVDAFMGGKEKPEPRYPVECLKELSPAAAGVLSASLCAVERGIAQSVPPAPLQSPLPSPLAAQPKVDPADALSRRVLDFYRFVEECFSTHPAFADVAQTTQHAVINELERYLLTHYYERLFRVTAEDEALDIALQRRIRALRWITPAHLEARIVPTDAEATAMFEEAQMHLILIDAKQSTEDKLACIVQASKSIFDALQRSSKEGSVASADDFLPVLIYAVLKANPPLLHSNLQFINRFCNPSRLNSGEGGYYFTNLYGAVSFIEKLSASHLKIPEDEFRRRMTGDLAPHGLPVTQNQSMLRSFLDRLQHLSARQGLLRDEMASLSDDIDKMMASTVAPVQRSPRAARPSPRNPRKV